MSSEIDESLAYIRKTLASVPLDDALSRLTRALALWHSEGQTWRVKAGKIVLRDLSDLWRARNEERKKADDERKRIENARHQAAETKPVVPLTVFNDSAREAAVKQRIEHPTLPLFPAPARAESWSERRSKRLGRLFLERAAQVVDFSDDRDVIVLEEGCLRILPKPGC